MADEAVKKYTVYYNLANGSDYGNKERFERGLEAIQKYDCDEFGIDWMQMMCICSNYDRSAGIDTQFCFPIKYYVAVDQHFGARKNQKKAHKAMTKIAMDGWNQSDSMKPDPNDISIG